MKTKATLALTLLVWCGMTAFGFWRLWEYETTPGAVRPSPRCWPAGASVPLDPSRPTLVLLAHPRCPCTQAGLDELERLLARCQGLVTVHVLVYKPGRSPAGWEQTRLWRRAAAIPGVTVRPDEDGAEAYRFGAATSGTALLYDSGGRLLFRGGLTNTRGHAGDSVGCQAIRALLAGKPAPTAETPVYGCPLGQPETPTVEDPWKQ
jgi:hypothetical protein